MRVFSFRADGGGWSGGTVAKRDLGLRAGGRAGGLAVSIVLDSLLSSLHLASCAGPGRSLSHSTLILNPKQKVGRQALLRKAAQGEATPFLPGGA